MPPLASRSGWPLVGKATCLKRGFFRKACKHDRRPCLPLPLAARGLTIAARHVLRQACACRKHASVETGESMALEAIAMKDPRRVSTNARLIATCSRGWERFCRPRRRPGPRFSPVCRSAAALVEVTMASRPHAVFCEGAGFGTATSRRHARVRGPWLETTSWRLSRDARRLGIRVQMLCTSFARGRHPREVRNSPARQSGAPPRHYRGLGATAR
jgi:hypothetical protein